MSTRYDRRKKEWPHKESILEPIDQESIQKEIENPFLSIILKLSEILKFIIY